MRHRLYESLISSASAGGQRLEIPGEFTSDEWFGTGMLEYTKHVPYGRVNASTGVSYSMQQNTERGAALSVFDESHVYNDPLPIVLNRRNIVAGSIVVTAIGGFPTYVEGVDYTVDLFPDRAELRVVVGQGIANGQSVLVDYDVGPEGASRIGTTGTSLSFRYTITEGSLEGLSVFVQYRMTDHSLDTDAPALIVLDDSSDLAVGAEYARGGLTARMEQVLHESTLNPYDSWRARANYDLRLSVDSTISFEATHERTDYSSPANAVALSRAGVKWTERLGARLELVARFVYRDESNTLSGDSRGFEESIGVKWGRGRTSGYASFRNAVLDGTGSTTATQRLEFGVRREF